MRSSGAAVWAAVGSSGASVSSSGAAVWAAVSSSGAAMRSVVIACQRVHSVA